jgi:hypothetical protein
VPLAVARLAADAVGPAAEAVAAPAVPAALAAPRCGVEQVWGVLSLPVSGLPAGALPQVGLAHGVASVALPWLVLAQSVAGVALPPPLTGE